MPTDIARRPNGTAPQQNTSTAVAIRTGQVEFDDKQRAALVAMGVSEQVTRAELAVFFHQCRKLQLDPFTKQIYLIHRKTKEGDRYVLKPTTQIGIDGFRVTRDRIAAEKGLRVEYEDTIWYDASGQAFDVWLWDEPPAACKFVVLVDGRRFPAVLRFNEYCQRTRDGVPTGRWKDGFAHQIEKCAEADALRRAFPNDLSGVILTDAAPMDDADAPAERQRVTGDQARQRGQQHRQQAQPHVVDAVVVEDAPPPPEPPTAGFFGDPRDGVIAEFDRLAVTPLPERLDYAARFLKCEPLGGINAITGPEAERLTAVLARCGNRAQLDELLNAGEAPDGQ